MADDVWSVLDGHLPRALELRRCLHARPTLSGEEWSTRDRVVAALPPFDSYTEVAGTGAVLRFGPTGPAVALRGEMDALPVTEKTGVEWQSRSPGVMHACGHDAHLAAVVAVAWTLRELGDHVPLVVVLQPREETYPSGARDVVESDVLTGERATFMVGAHVQPALPPGTVACVPGAVNASSDEFEIEVHGESGHAAYPHLTDDPLLALSEIVVALQSVVSRSVDPMMSAVVGVSSFQSGTAANVVPGLARATGTIRALSPETRTLLQERVVSIAENVARAHGCRAEVVITSGEPVLQNDPDLVAAVSRHLDDRGLCVSTTLRSVGADDFSYFSEQLPSAMMFVGSESSAALHSSTFLPTDADVRDVARAMLAGYLGAADLVLGPTGASRSGEPRREGPATKVT